MRTGGFYKEENPHPRAQSDGRFIRSLARSPACLPRFQLLCCSTQPPSPDRKPLYLSQKGKNRKKETGKQSKPNQDLQPQKPAKT